MVSPPCHRFAPLLAALSPLFLRWDCPNSRESSPFCPKTEDKREQRDGGDKTHLLKGERSKRVLRKEVCVARSSKEKKKKIEHRSTREREKKGSWSLSLSLSPPSLSLFSVSLHCLCSLPWRERGHHEPGRAGARLEREGSGLTDKAEKRQRTLSNSRLGVAARIDVLAVPQPVVVHERRVLAAVLPSLAVRARLTFLPVATCRGVARRGAGLGVPVAARAAVGSSLVLLELRERAPVGREPLLPVVVGAVLEEGAAVVVAGGLCVCVDFFLFGGGGGGKGSKSKAEETSGTGKEGSEGSEGGP